MNKLQRIQEIEIAMQEIEDMAKSIYPKRSDQECHKDYHGYYELKKELKELDGE